MTYHPIVYDFFNLWDLSSENRPDLKPLLHVQTFLRLLCNGVANKFHKGMLHGETRVFVTTAIVAIVAEVESGSTFGETCLATEVQKVSRNRPC